jgi:hypothetical protein
MAQGNTLVKELRTLPDDAPAAGSTQLAPAVLADAGGALFERLARDPSVDVDKLERLMALWERNESRTAEAAFNSAMSAAQDELRPVAADAENPQTKSRYASYGALDRAVRPVYARHGFALSFDTGDSPLAEHVRVLCYVSHRGGHQRTHHVDMPADGKGAKGGDVMTKTHAAGAAMSYGQRYLLKLIFNIAVGEDRDGNAPAAPSTAPEGYDAWWTHMQQVAQRGGFPALEAAWETSAGAFKTFANKSRKSEWEALKRDALKVKIR